MRNSCYLAESININFICRLARMELIDTSVCKKNTHSKNPMTSDAAASASDFAAHVYPQKLWLCLLCKPC